MKLLPAFTTTQHPDLSAFTNRVFCCDALDLLAALPDASVDLIATDPPYFKVKNSAWDNQWDTPHEFIAWLRPILAEYKRVLKPNGSLYLFASPRMAARVEVAISDYFNVLNNIRWVKEQGWHNRTNKDEIRSYLQPQETIIFAEQFNSDNFAKGDSSYTDACDNLRGFIFEPLRSYLDTKRIELGWSFDDVRKIVKCADGSGLPSHWFTSSQWSLPSKEKYIMMQSVANGHLRREYEELRQEYEDLRRPFNSSPYRPYTDVWTYRTVQAYTGKHECEKPLDMMKHIIETSSRADSVVLDTFAGSGVTLDAARQLGRKFIGCDMSAHWTQEARKRVEKMYTISLFDYASTKAS